MIAKFYGDVTSVIFQDTQLASGGFFFLFFVFFLNLNITGLFFEWYNIRSAKVRTADIAFKRAMKGENETI
jgi:hypothetical protein